MDHRGVFYGQHQVCEHSVRAENVHKEDVNM